MLARRTKLSRLRVMPQRGLICSGTPEMGREIPMRHPDTLLDHVVRVCLQLDLQFCAFCIVLGVCLLYPLKIWRLIWDDIDQRRE